MNLILIGVFFSTYLILLIISFLLGYILGNKEETKPVIVKKKKKNKEVEEEIEDPVRIMLENIDNYDGTSLGQKDVPEDEEEW